MNKIEDNFLLYLNNKELDKEYFKINHKYYVYNNENNMIELVPIDFIRKEKKNYLDWLNIKFLYELELM